ncbi:MAG TPA: hypothetical protein PLA83_01710 [Deltaproteobacteria bacterium]|nr:hypothetical protein [Deltaproteobacteria bacterium]HQI00500.1 hypothetical protein [Deltaproteobacteria bacterium]HQJ08571.1 hypothetical protein [Deltaproteobacteria bacterium]
MNIEYKKENEIGLFRLEGTKRYYEARLAWWRFLQAFKDDDIKAALVFDNSVNEITPADVLDLEQWFCEINFPRQRKVAIVNSDSREEVINRYWDFVGSMRRWSIKVFDNEHAARRWLKMPSLPRRYRSEPGEQLRPHAHRVAADPAGSRWNAMKAAISTRKGEKILDSRKIRSRPVIR